MNEEDIRIIEIIPGQPWNGCGDQCIQKANTPEEWLACAYRSGHVDTKCNSQNCGLPKAAALAALRAKNAELERKVESLHHSLYKSEMCHPFPPEETFEAWKIRNHLTPPPAEPEEDV